MACSIHSAGRKRAGEPTPASDVSQRRWRVRVPGTARNAFQHYRNEDQLNLSHAGTAVSECFKDNDASQWESIKFDPFYLPPKTWTDGY